MRQCGDTQEAEQEGKVGAACVVISLGKANDVNRLRSSQFAGFCWALEYKACPPWCLAWANGADGRQACSGAEGESVVKEVCKA